MSLPLSVSHLQNKFLKVSSNWQAGGTGDNCDASANLVCCAGKWYPEQSGQKEEAAPNDAYVAVDEDSA